MNDNVITTAASEGTTGAAGAADTAGASGAAKTGEQMLYDVIAGDGSENSGDVADPAVTEDADDTDPSGEESNTDSADDSGDGDTTKQDDKTNAVYAKARRQAEEKLKAERQKFEREKQEQIDTGINSAIKELGLYDPETKKPITDAAGLKAYRESMAKRRMEQAAGAKGMTADELKELVELHPDVAAAKAEREQQKVKAAEQARQAAENRLNADIAEIGKINPQIKSFGDLRSLDRFSDIYDKIKMGISPLDAYRLVYMDQIIDSRTAEAGQRVRNGTQGKSHMHRMTGAAEGAAEVPDSEVSVYRMLTGKSDADARAKLGKFHR